MRQQEDGRPLAGPEAGREAIARHAKCFGTGEPPALREVCNVGQLSFVLAGGSLANLCWRGVEVIRGINCLVRDENWGTYAAQDVGESRSIDPADGAFVYRRNCTVADGALAVEFSVTARSEGELVASARIAAHRDFVTNRAGLTLLHPVQDVAGSPLRVTHPDGASETVSFPRLISPSQPVFAIAGLAHDVRGVEVSLRFEGEVFEMEDQRNWADASFKTYCRPLSRPRPFVIASGETVEQTIRVTLSGAPRAQASAADKVGSARMPEIMLALESGWLPDTRGLAALSRCKGTGLLLRVDADAQGVSADPAPFAALARSIAAAVDLEIVLRGQPRAPTDVVMAVASRCANAGLRPRHVFALPEAYLKSYQPTEPAPPGPTPEECLAAVRSAFPTALAGAGMLTNFTEFNRRRPAPEVGDYVTHSSTAIVHAADDTSVLETLEALPQVFASARHIAGERPYRLGLVSIGMRTNPHGVAVNPNPDLRRLTMAEYDPRQRGLFAAAYAIGVAVAAAFGGVQAIALAAPAGPFGVMEKDQQRLRLFPIFHAVKALSALSGAPLTALRDLPAGVVGVRDAAGRLIAANCSLEPRTFTPPAPLSGAVLDSASFDVAATDADWSTRNAVQLDTTVELEPCACLFATTGAAA